MWKLMLGSEVDCVGCAKEPGTIVEETLPSDASRWTAGGNQGLLASGS